jgi:hypothetical protein
MMLVIKVTFISSAAMRIYNYLDESEISRVCNTKKDWKDSFEAKTD